MKIEVWKRYDRDRVKMPIEEGIYDESDRKIQGIARFLIDNGNARIVADIAPAIEEQDSMIADIVAAIKTQEEEVIEEAPSTKDDKYNRQAKGKRK